MKATIGKSMAGALALAAAAWAHDGNHGGLLFSAALDGAQEVPAVATDARGLVGFKLNEAMDTMRIEGAVAGLKGTITKFHLHAGKRGEAGPLAVDLMSFVSGSRVAGIWTGFSRADLSAFMRGAYYVNVHTSAFPDGEIRGQVEPEQDRLFLADIMGWDEVPQVETAARGVGIFRLSADDSTLDVRLALTGLDSVTALHIHKGAAGANGPPVADLFGALEGGLLDTTLRISALADGKAFLDSLAQGSLYVNVHTRKVPSGEIRGQMRVASGRALVADLRGAHEVPAVETAAAGLAYAVLSDDDSLLTVRAVFSGLDTITAAHIHKAASGANGGVAADLASFRTGAVVAGAVKVSSLAGAEAFVDALVRGGTYINVHTKKSPSGEIRGQLLFQAREGYIIRLEGAQEVPAVSTEAYGVAVASLSKGRGALRFQVLASGLYGSLTAAHFHKAAAGANGAPVFHLTSYFDGPFASGVWSALAPAAPLSADLAADFLAGGLYLNVHSGYHPAGEIRGQAADPAPHPATALRPSASRALDALVAAPGRALRLRGRPGSTVTLRVADLSGRVRATWPLRIGPDGLSAPADISRLSQGRYVAGWNGGGIAGSAPLTRP